MQKMENCITISEWFFQQMQNSSSDRTDELGYLENLTVIVPSYERQDFLLRQMAYWRGTKVRLIVADGSRVPIDSEIINAAQNQIQLTYLHNQGGIVDRLSMATAHIKTEYAVLSGDDEFLLGNGLCCAIKKLQHDHSLVACIGQSLGFYISGSDFTVSYGSGYPHWKYEIRQDEQAERLRAAMTAYTAATCYAVVKADLWRKTWAYSKNWSSPYASEMQQAISTYLSGKLSTVDEVYWMRSYENKPVSIKGSNRTLSFEEWWTTSKFESEKKEFIDLLSLEATEAGKADLLQARGMIVEAVEIYLAPERLRKNSISGLPALSAFFRSRVGKILKNVLSEEQFIKLKSLIYESRGVAGAGNFGGIKELAQLEGNPLIRVDDQLLSELSEMEVLISGFYQARQG